MLLQSHAGEINLLPALPKAWARGAVTGLRARGGFEVDLRWEAWKLASAQVRATAGGNCRLRTAQPIEVRAGGKAVQTRSASPGQIEFPAVTGQAYDIIPR